MGFFFCAFSVNGCCHLHRQCLLHCFCVRLLKFDESRRHRTHFSIVNLSHQFILFSFSNDAHVSCQHDCATNTKTWSVQRALSASFKCKIHVSQHDDHLQFLHVFSRFFSVLCFWTVPFLFSNAFSIVFTSNHCCLLLFYSDVTSLL